MPELGRLLTAMVTPYTPGGEVDYAHARRLAAHLVRSGNDGLVLAGTTGEAPLLSDEEKFRLWSEVKQELGDSATVVAGAGTNDTRHSIHLSHEAERAGVDGILAVVPYYLKPPQEGIFQHFRAIAESTRLPVIVYNVPGRTGIDLLPETVATLARHPHIVGIKEATGDMTRIARLRELIQSDEFDLLSGDDFTIFPFIALGGHGVISVTSNVAPAWISALCNAATSGNWTEARSWHYKQLPLARALFNQPNPIPVKSALALLGRMSPEMRLPLVAIDPQSREGQTLADTLHSLGLHK